MGAKCEVRNCSKKRHYTKNWCRKHYTRWLKYGDTKTVLISGRKGDPEGFRREKAGYWRVKCSDHPLADSKGWVLEHRMKLYDKLGKGPHPCWACGETLTWKLWRRDETRQGRIVVNHLNEDGLDNRLRNIVISCNLCNRAYSRMFQLMDKFGLKKRKITRVIEEGRRRRCAFYTQPTST